MSVSQSRDEENSSHRQKNFTSPESWNKIKIKSVQQDVNWELPDVQAGLEKAEEPEIKLPTFDGS